MCFHNLFFPKYTIYCKKLALFTLYVWAHEKTMLNWRGVLHFSKRASKSHSITAVGELCRVIKPESEVRGDIHGTDTSSKAG